MAHPALLALEDGTVFQGKAFGAVGNAQSIALGEVVFNTAMTGYQEILTDPSYCNQLITLTYPHIGNVGINSVDLESKRIYAKGLIIRDLPYLASNWRKKQTLDEWLKTQNIVGIKNIDTRKLTRLLREKGSLRGCILTNTIINEKIIGFAIQQAKDSPSIQGCDLAKEVTTDSCYIWPSNTCLQNSRSHDKNYSNYRVIVYDFGVKHSILKALYALGLCVYVVPATTDVNYVLSLKPNGILFSNGPGDPQPCTYAIEAMKEFLRLKLPIFGICLGFQILALALGAKTYKMKFGHHGGNHPVQDLESKSVMITSQNHGFAVKESTLPPTVKITHRSLFDNTIQGFQHTFLPAFGFQGHPEAGPGPHDAHMLFLRFLDRIKACAFPQNQAVSLET